MNERIGDRCASAVPTPQRIATVTELSSRRRRENLLDSVTFFVGGQNYGTFTIKAPIPAGTQLRLYVVERNDDPAHSRNGAAASMDCLVTDDASVASDELLPR